MVDSSYLARRAAVAGMDDLLPVGLAAKRLGVTPAAIKGWAARGRIEPVDTDPRWGRLYRVRDLVKIEALTADSANRRSRTRTRDAIAA